MFIIANILGRVYDSPKVYYSKKNTKYYKFTITTTERNAFSNKLNVFISVFAYGEVAEYVEKLNLKDGKYVLLYGDYSISVKYGKVYRNIELSDIHVIQRLREDESVKDFINEENSLDEKMVEIDEEDKNMLLGISEDKELNF